MTPPELVDWLREEAKRAVVNFRSSIELLESADLIESLTAERDGLAGMVVAKDEALLEMTNDAMDNDPRPEPFSPVVQSALYIELPAAAIQVAGWKRKAELADWLASEDTTEINETQSSRGQEAWVVRQLDKLGFWDSLRDEKACSDRYKAAAKEAENANKA